MYETPQYLTPNGFKRQSTNPYKKLVDKLPLAKQTIDLHAVKAETKRLLTTRPAKKKEFELSDEAAKFFASAIKGMLKQ